MCAKNLLPVALFLSLFFTPVLARHTALLGYLSDAVIAIIAAVVAWRLISARAVLSIPLHYILVFSLFLYVAMAGIVLSAVPSLAVVAGVRSYLKYVPLFLLPFAYHYTERDLRLQFHLLIALALLQLPVTLWQRFVHYADFGSGDPISGTLSVTNSLTIILLALVTVLTALYLRRGVSLSRFIILSLLLFLPCTLNETKATAILFPVGIGSVLFFMRREISLRRLIFLLVTGLVLLGAFVSIYDNLYSRDIGFIERITDKNAHLASYNMTGAQAAPNALRSDEAHVVGTIARMRADEGFVGRFDSFRIAVETLYKHDPPLLLLGLGIGNVNSSIGNGGVYQAIARELGGTMTSLSMLLWETGLAGASVYVLFLLLIARDSLALSRGSDLWGTSAAGVFGVTLIIIAALPYNNMFHLDEIPGLFIYFGGLVAYGRWNARGC